MIKVIIRTDAPEFSGRDGGVQVAQVLREIAFRFEKNLTVHKKDHSERQGYAFHITGPSSGHSLAKVSVDQPGDTNYEVEILRAEGG